MKYYEQLIQHMDRSMQAHPRSMLVMDADTFKIIARGRNTRKLTRQLRRGGARHGVTVVFQRPDESAVWILASHPRL